MGFLKRLSAHVRDDNGNLGGYVLEANVRQVLRGEMTIDQWWCG